MMGRMRLSIVVPAHNEEARIGRMLDAYLPHFHQRYGRDVELIVVVNGTTDRTEQVVAAYQSRFPILRLLVEPARIGKGGALILGFKAAVGEWVGFVDADGATPPEAFQDLVDRIGDAGAIVASRWAAGARVSPRQPPARRIASRVFNLMTRMLFGLRLTDSQCGAKLMRREALQEVLPHLGITRWAFDVDLLFQFKRAGHGIREIPTVWSDVEGSKIEDIGKVSFEMAAALTRLRLLYSPFRFVVAVYDRFIGPWLHPADMEQDHLLRHSLILFAGGQVSNVCNLVFQLVVVRMLTNADYGVLAAMTGTLALIGMPLGALGGTVTHFTAQLAKEGRREQINGAVLAVLRDVTIGATVLLAVTVLGGQAMAGYYQLDSVVPVWITALLLVASVIGTVLGGVLSGMQAFVWGTVTGNAASVLRVLLATVLVACGLSATGALTAQLLATIFSVGLIVFAWHRLLGLRCETGVSWHPGTYSYFLGFLVTMGGYAVLSNADLVLVKHYFPSGEAGGLAKADMVARVVIFMPQPIIQAMFPKVVSAGHSSAASRKTVFKALIMVTSMVAALLLVCLAFPLYVMRGLAGAWMPELVPCFRVLVTAFSLLSVTAVIMNYELAQRRFAIMIPLIACAAAYVAGMAYWHRSLLQAAGVVCVASLASLILAAAFLPWRRLGREGAPS